MNGCSLGRAVLLAVVSMETQAAGIAQYLQRRASWETRFIPTVVSERAFGLVPFPLLVYLALSKSSNYLLITSLALPKPHKALATPMPE